VSIRFKVILPYLLLTLVVAVTGVYVVTRLVSNSLSERLKNQLLEAGRVVSDTVARQEIKHIESARLIANLIGLPEALSTRDQQAISALAKPAAAGLRTESLIIVDEFGREQLNLLVNDDGSVQEISQQTGAGNLAIVQLLLLSDDPESLPHRGIGQNPVNGKYYYYTALPVSLNGKIVGVVVVGTSLEKMLPYLKSTSLADIIVYVDNGKAIATTLNGPTGDDGFLKALSLPADEYKQILGANDNVTGQNIVLNGRYYSLARSSLQVGSDRIGVFAVALPLEFVLESGSVSRNTYVLLFALVMLGVVLIGYAISRLIINPLSSLLRTSQAIADGDLKQRTGIRSRDEIGDLATNFDEMTARLAERTNELERTYHTLEQMDRTKISFIEVSAHELRTPLTLVKGYSQMLAQKFKDNVELQALTEGILDGTDRMTEVVSNMLDVSRIDSKILKLVPEEMNIGVIISRVYTTFKEALQERHLSLSVQGVEGLPTIYADPDQLYKVFYHLVMNAIKYTPDGGRITIQGHVVEEQPGKREIEVSVADTGIGIAPEHHEFIFEKFYQTGEVLLHSSGKTKFKGGGPGLGLAIARGIVEAHKGRIWVESPGYDETKLLGSKFFVRLQLDNRTEVKKDEVDTRIKS
jgi:signal transduction histidine kinase